MSTEARPFRGVLVDREGRTIASVEGTVREPADGVASGELLYSRDNHGALIHGNPYTLAFDDGRQAEIDVLTYGQETADGQYRAIFIMRPSV